MAMITKETFPRLKSWVGVTAIDASADIITVNEQDIRFFCVSGNIWVNPATTAIANATSILLTSGQHIDLNVKSALSIISDVTGGTYQYIIL